MSFVIDSVIAYVKRSIAAIGPRIEKWSQAHHQAVQDRIFWELALSDRALMEELRAARARSAGASARIDFRSRARPGRQTWRSRYSSAALRSPMRLAHARQRLQRRSAR